MNKELKTINQEIESYNRQLMELEKKERNADSGNQKHDRRELVKANNAMKSAIHQKLVVREKEKFGVQEVMNKTKRLNEEMLENLTTYSSILVERKRALVNKYLMKD